MIDSDSQFNSMEDDMNKTFKRHLDEIIEGLNYLRNIMAIPEMAKRLKRSYKNEFQILEGFGTEF